MIDDDGHTQIAQSLRSLRRPFTSRFCSRRFSSLGGCFVTALGLLIREVSALDISTLEFSALELSTLELSALEVPTSALEFPACGESNLSEA